MESEKQKSRDAQARKFAETARALGADEDEAAFRAKLAVIARQKPKNASPPIPKLTKAPGAAQPPKRRRRP